MRSALFLVLCLRALTGTALAQGEGMMYWTSRADGIYRMRADRNGTNRELVITGLDRVDGIALDTLNHQMYWTEPGRLSRAHLDGSKPRLLVAGKTSACASVVALPSR